MTRHWARRASAGAAILALVAGCASKQSALRWQKPGGTRQELDRARAECEAEPAVDEVQVAGQDVMDAKVRGTAFVRCMESKGWTWDVVEVEEPAR